jgi:hypothetical protein
MISRPYALLPFNGNERYLIHADREGRKQCAHYRTDQHGQQLPVLVRLHTLLDTKDGLGYLALFDTMA